MSNENLNNNWKSRLDELDSLPGETKPDRNMVWEKLYSRIGGRRAVSKKKPLYTAFAACLLLAMIISVVVVTKKDGLDSNSQVNTKKESSVTNDVVTTPSKIPTEIKTIPALEHKKPIPVSKKNINIKQLVNDVTTVEKIRVSDTVSAGVLSKEIVSESPVRVDSSNSSHVAFENKRKLKVVHINELGITDEVPPEIAGKRALHSIRLKLASQEVYSRPSVAINKEGFTIFKTKTSPSE